MGILHIGNRTENWKTASHFAPFLEDRNARTELANRLLKPLDKLQDIRPYEVKFELFWKGARDYLDQCYDKNVKRQALVKGYQSIFNDLRKRIDDFRNTKQSIIQGIEATQL